MEGWGDSRKEVSVLGSAILVDGTAINWSVESAPVKTNINIFFAEQSAIAIRLQKRRMVLFIVYNISQILALN